MWDEFDRRGARVVAIAQEDTDLEQHARLPAALGDDLPFEIVADLNRERTAPYDRTTTYLLDADGVVRQVFPQMIHHRATWRAILREMDRQGLTRKPAPEGSRP